MFDLIEIDVVKTTWNMTNIYIKTYPKGVIIAKAIIEVKGQNAQTANESFLKVMFWNEYILSQLQFKIIVFRLLKKLMLKFYELLIFRTLIFSFKQKKTLNTEIYSMVFKILKKWFKLRAVTLF